MFSLDWQPVNRYEKFELATKKQYGGNLTLKKTQPLSKSCTSLAIVSRNLVHIKEQYLRIKPISVCSPSFLKCNQPILRYCCKTKPKIRALHPTKPGPSQSDLHCPHERMSYPMEPMQALIRLGSSESFLNKSPNS